MTFISDRLKYYTSDCSGSRFVVTGFIEEACNRFAFRDYIWGSYRSAKLPI